MGFGAGTSSPLYNWSGQSNGLNGIGNANSNVSGIYIEIDGGNDNGGTVTTTSNAVHPHGTRRELPTVS